jgi:hypothetical protein
LRVAVYFLNRCQDRFIASESELPILKEAVKTLTCIHCKQVGTLNNHGALTDQSGSLRGLRFWCSSRRGSRPGCGQSFSIWLATVVPGNSVPALSLACFFLSWSRLGGDVLGAWQAARTGFSTDSAYRWVKCLLHNQGEVRSRLCRVRAPPPTRGGGILADLFEHLSLVLESEGFIKAFQIRFQRPWPMGI